MLNRTPPSNKSTSDVLNAYRKRRQQRGPFLIYGVAALLLIAGIAVVVKATMGGNNPISGFFPTDTPTPTLTFTPTNTNTPTITPTITFTPTITLTPTRSGPISYTIVENDTLEAIAKKFDLGIDGVGIIYDANPEILANGGYYNVGQSIVIPKPGTLRNTPTPIPADLVRGKVIEYQVESGDTLAGIAVKFNSKEEEIITLNKIENANSLQAGQVLKIPVNLVTATATLPPSSTPVTPTIEGQPTQAAATATLSVTCTPAEDTNFITELQTLINTDRTSNNLTGLNINQNLATAAKNHAIDMVCNNYLSHIGLNKSTPEERVAAQGYTASLVAENIFALPTSNVPQSAFNWWMNDPASRSAILNPDLTEFGVAYVFSDKSLLGGYFVVVFAKP